MCAWHLTGSILVLTFYARLVLTFYARATARNSDKLESDVYLWQIQELATSQTDQLVGAAMGLLPLLSD